MDSLSGTFSSNTMTMGHDATTEGFQPNLFSPIIPACISAAREMLGLSPLNAQCEAGYSSSDKLRHLRIVSHILDSGNIVVAAFELFVDDLEGQVPTLAGRSRLLGGHHNPFANVELFS